MKKLKRDSLLYKLFHERLAGCSAPLHLFEKLYVHNQALYYYTGTSSLRT
jgi:hypothetical protein